MGRTGAFQNKRERSTWPLLPTASSPEIHPRARDASANFPCTFRSEAQRQRKRGASPLPTCGRFVRGRQKKRRELKRGQLRHQRRDEHLVFIRVLVGVD